MNSHIHVEATSALAALSLLVPDQERASTGPVEVSMIHNLQTVSRQPEVPNLTETSGLKVAASTPVMLPSLEKKWTMNQMPRFMSLLEKHSLLEATKEEEAELEQLRKLKGHAEDPRTADELLLEWKFQQRVDQIVKLLDQTKIHGSERENAQNSPWYSA